MTLLRSKFTESFFKNNSLFGGKKIPQGFGSNISKKNQTMEIKIRLSSFCAITGAHGKTGGLRIPPPKGDSAISLEI